MAYNPHLSPHSAGDLDPEAIAVRVFAEARRGYEPSEVQAYLQVVAEEFRAAHQREHELRLHIADLERQLYDTEERVMAAEARAHDAATAASQHAVGSPTGTANLSLLDESQLTVLVGEETAKVLGAARGAASEIRANAERTAAEIHRKATEAAEQIAARAEAALEQRAREADSEAARRLDETDAAIELSRAEATEQLARLRAEADNAAAASVADAQQALDDARADAARILEQAGHDAQQRRADADGEAAQLLADSHEAGRQLVAEAQQVRTRLLEDLLRRRKLLRRQVEQLHAGRERFLAAFAIAHDAMRDIDDELARTLPEARAAAEAAGRIADETPDASTAGLESMLAAAAAPSAAPSDAPSDAPVEPAASVFTRLRADRGQDAGSERDEVVPPTAEAAAEPAVVDAGDADGSHRPVPHLSVVPPPAMADDEPAEVEAAPVEDEPADDGGVDPLLTRDALLDDLTRPVVRVMKRALTDEQNDVLDAVRRRRPLPSLDELLSPVAEHERRYAEATVGALAKAAGAGRALPAVLADPDADVAAGSSADPDDLASVREVAAALAVEVVGALRAALEECLADAELLRASPGGRAPGSRGPTKAAVTAQADEVADRVRLAYRDARNRRVDEAATTAVRTSFARGLQAAGPPDVVARLLDGLPADLPAALVTD